MEFLKKVWQWLKHPRIWWFAVTLVLFVAALAATLAFIAFVSADSPFYAAGYILYFLSAILLAYTVYCIIKIAPGAKRRVKERAMQYEFTKKMLEQYGFRTVVFAVVSFVISIGNAAINLTIGIMWVSLWFIALGAYYLLLASMRGGILLYHRKKSGYDEEQTQNKATKIYLICGILLILLPVALSGAIWEIVGSGKAFVRSGMMIYVAAAYTFYKIIMSVYNFAKARKTDQMSIRAIRNVNLADALVSVLALQTAMFHEFSPEENMGLANAVMGAVVCALTALIGIFMVVNACLKLKRTGESVNG